jgi:hypothetical protein
VTVKSKSVLRDTYYRTLTVMAPLSASTTHGAVTVRDCENIEPLFSSRSIRLSMHLLPLPHGHGSVSGINYIPSRDRKGAVKGAGDARAFECRKKAFDAQAADEFETSAETHTPAEHV